jgi:hypothetical protein
MKNELKNCPPIYMASRASVPARPALWNKLRDEVGWNIVSTWHNPENMDQDRLDMRSLWRVIPSEIALCHVVVLYVEQGDLPLKGAFIECGMALALGKPVIVVYPNIGDREHLRKHLGSWISHPQVVVTDRLETAIYILTRENRS